MKRKAQTGRLVNGSRTGCGPAGPAQYELNHWAIHSADLGNGPADTANCPICQKVQAWKAHTSGRRRQEITMHEVDRLLSATRQAEIAERITTYVEAEDNLPSRHQGAKGRKTALATWICEQFCEPCAAPMMGRWLDWAVLTWEMRLQELTPAKIGEIIASTLTDGWT